MKTPHIFFNSIVNNCLIKYLNESLKIAYGQKQFAQKCKFIP